MLDRRQAKRVVKKTVEVARAAEFAAREIDFAAEALSAGAGDSKEIEELEALLSQLEQEVDSVDGFTDKEIKLLTEPLEIEFVETVHQATSPERDLRDPMEAFQSLFAESVEEQMDRESLREQLRWESFDYLAVGTAGTLASITDFILVGLPAGLRAGPITAWMKQYNTTERAGRDDWFAVVARYLEQVCKVPYDTLKGSEAIAGMSGRTHRFQTLGHDPVLGFVFGVLDILRGTVTGFSYDKLQRLHGSISMASPSGRRDVGLIESFLMQIGHLLSDIATPSGLPAPFLTIFQAFNSGQFGKDKMTVSEVARWMYTHGYDLRHFLASGLSVGVGKAVLVGLLMLREVTEGAPSFKEFKEQIKYRRMLLATHSLAALGNAGKITLHQGNPLAINQSQWMAFLNLLGPYLRERALQEELELRHLQGLNEEGWAGLLAGRRRREEVDE